MGQASLPPAQRLRSHRRSGIQQRKVEVEISKSQSVERGSGNRAGKRRGSLKNGGVGEGGKGTWLAKNVARAIQRGS